MKILTESNNNIGNMEVGDLLYKYVCPVMEKYFKDKLLIKYSDILEIKSYYDDWTGNAFVCIYIYKDGIKGESHRINILDVEFHQDDTGYFRVRDWNGYWPEGDDSNYLVTLDKVVDCIIDKIDEWYEEWVEEAEAK